MLLDWIIKIKDSLFTWQTLVGSMIGAITPLFIVWIVEKNKSKKERKEYLYFLERMLVDQINMLVEVRSTITSFLDEKVKELLNHIDSNPASAYSVDGIFLPLFSVRSLPEEINMKNSSSGYIDNKVGKVYALSKDLPHIVDDIRFQLRDTLDRNEKIAFGKLNSPDAQKQQYKRNIEEFGKMTRRDILEKNIPISLKLFTETLIAVREKAKHPLLWKVKFDIRWRFYLRNSDYVKAKSEIMDNMDLYFKPLVDKQLEIINNFK